MWPLPRDLHTGYHSGTREDFTPVTATGTSATCQTGSSHGIVKAGHTGVCEGPSEHIGVRELAAGTAALNGTTSRCLRVFSKWGVHTNCFFFFNHYSKFFGAKNPAPQQQTKLSFTTKSTAASAPILDADEGDASTKENTDPDQG